MKLDLEYIEELAKLVNERGLSEVSLKDGEQAITVKKDMLQTPLVRQSTILQTPQMTEQESKEPEKRGHAITAPMVGTFYSSSSKTSEPFVTVGKTINSGDVVCIIEAMKLMNEIESEFSGIVTEICVKNGEPVEYGQILMYIE